MRDAAWERTRVICNGGVIGSVRERPDYPKSTTTSTISQMGNVQTKSEITASTKRM